MKVRAQALASRSSLWVQRGEGRQVANLPAGRRTHAAARTKHPCLVTSCGYYGRLKQAARGRPRPTKATRVHLITLQLIPLTLLVTNGSQEDLSHGFFRTASPQPFLIYSAEDPANSHKLATARLSTLLYPGGRKAVAGVTASVNTVNAHYTEIHRRKPLRKAGLTPPESRQVLSQYQFRTTPPATVAACGL